MCGGIPSAPARVRRSRYGSTSEQAPSTGTMRAVSAIARLYVEGRRSVRIAAMAGFSVRFLGCKVSQTDAQALRERLLLDGHIEGGGEVAVVNTCCVTNEALAKSRQAASRAARTHRRVYVTGCGARLSANAFAGLPENVTVVPGQIEDAV